MKVEEIQRRKQSLAVVAATRPSPSWSLRRHLLALCCCGSFTMAVVAATGAAGAMPTRSPVASLLAIIEPPTPSTTTCTSCTSSSDCATGFECSNSTCRHSSGSIPSSCWTNSDCSAGMVCDNTTLTCENRCPSDLDCHGLVCNLDLGYCIATECLTSEQCDGFCALCNIHTGNCVSCLRNADCHHLWQVCHNATGSCVDIVCQDNAERQDALKCDTITGNCVSQSSLSLSNTDTSTGNSLRSIAFRRLHENVWRYGLFIVTVIILYFDDLND